MVLFLCVHYYTLVVMLLTVLFVREFGGVMSLEEYPFVWSVFVKEEKK